MKTLDATNRDDLIAMHFDTEFDDGPAGFELISIGAVFESRRGREDFYAINLDYFNTASWKLFLSGKHPNQEWMMDNVFTRILGIREGERRVKSLAEIVDAGGAFTIPPQYQVSGGLTGHSAIVGNPATIAAALREVAVGLGAGEKRVQPIAYYCAHDMVLLARIFGGLMELPDGWNQYAWDLQMLGDTYGIRAEQFDVKPEAPHHSLHDAVAQHEAWNNLLDMIRENQAMDAYASMPWDD